MQNYSIKRPLSNRIIYVIALLSMPVASVFNKLIEYLSLWNGRVLPFLSTGLVFAALYCAFDRYLWKLPVFRLVSQTPNLNGTWQCKGVGKKQNDENANYPWLAEVTITQSFSEISVHLKTDSTSSQSSSFGAIIEKINNETWKLSYPYRNTPVNGVSDLHAHDGFCQLIFDLKKNIAEGSYFTNNDRKSFGCMKLTKMT